MLIVSFISGQRAAIFPEGVALAWGVWVLGRRDWCGLRVRLVLVPTICAACGVFATDHIYSRLLAEWAALSTAIVVLLVTRAPIGPSLAAAVLPTVAGVHSTVYVLAVVVIALVVLGGLVPRDSRTRKAPMQSAHRSPMVIWLHRWHWCGASPQLGSGQ